MRAIVSVIIAVYNDMHRIGQAIESVLAQTEQRWELIVVDDASNDETQKVVARYVACDSRVRYLRMDQNAGPSRCRNRGFAASEGDWLAVLDSDDIFARTRLADLLATGERQDADIVVDNLLLCPDGEPQQVMIPAAVLSKPRQMFFLEFMDECIWSKTVKRSAYVFMKPMFRKTFLQRTKIAYDPDCRNGEDFILYIDCFLAGAKWWLIPEPGYHYAIQDASLTTSIRTEDRGLMTAKLEAALASPQVEGDRALRTITRRHFRITASDYYFRSFRAAIKARDPRALKKVLFVSNVSAFYLATKLAAHVPVFIKWRIGFRS